MRTDEDWQEWEFPQLVQALRKWTERNPLKQDERSVEKSSFGSQPTLKKTKTFQARQQETKTKPCVYCEETGHKPSDCGKLATLREQKRVLTEKQLCFNCTGTKHKAVECRSQGGCMFCKRKHHTSICDRAGSTEHMLVATGDTSVTYPVVVVNGEGIKCQALLDTGAGSLYTSSALLERLQKHPVRREPRRIEMMMQSANQVIDLYKPKIGSIDGNFYLETEVTKVNRSHLLSKIPSIRRKLHFFLIFRV